MAMNYCKRWTETQQYLKTAILWDKATMIWIAKSQLCLLMQTENPLSKVQDQGEVQFVTCNRLFSQTRNTLSSQALFPFVWIIWMRCSNAFFQRHSTLAMHLYLFQMKSEVLSLSFPAMDVTHGKGRITIKSDHPWGFSQHHCWPIGITDLYSWKEVP